MTFDPATHPITLAVEHADLLPAAHQFCAHLAPDQPIRELPLDAFAASLDHEAQRDSLRVLMLRADADGHVGATSPLVQSIMATNVPLMVVRHGPGSEQAQPGIRRIVVPLDGSAIAGQAIPIASCVARWLKVPVRFVMVIDPSRVIPPAYAYDPDAWSMISELRETSHWALSQAESAMRSEGIDVSSELLFGQINTSLSVGMTDGDLIVMTTHGPDRAGLRYRDSVALRTLVSLPYPMLVMQANREDHNAADTGMACSWVEPLLREPAGTA